MTATTTAQRQTRGRVRVEQGAKRIRAYLGGQLVADTTRPLLVWEKPYYPTYYFPAADVRTELLTPDGGLAHSPSRGDAKTYSIQAGSGQRRAGAALHYEQSPFDELRDTIRLDWNALDSWFEEDEEVFTHARDPYTRIDILPSSRRVRIDIDGVTIAESTKPRLLFETGLPARYYLPKTDVRMDLLAPTETTSNCPYKGQAEYWSATIGETVHPDIAWSYRTPLPESQKITGLVCFYPERVDIYVDGQLVQ